MIFKIFKFTNIQGQIEWHLFTGDNLFPVVISTDFNDLERKMIELAGDSIDKPADMKMNENATYLGRPAKLFILESDTQRPNNVVAFERR
jgi:predicted metal-dependent RNase